MNANHFNSLAIQIVEEKLGEKPANIHLFSTGLSHFVFDVSTESSFSFVLRIARQERTKQFERGLFWHDKIENIGVRLPKIFSAGRYKDHPYAVYERLRGNDLENVYSMLTVHEKKVIAYEVAEIQKKISTLDRTLFNQSNNWRNFLEGIVNRSEKEILKHGLCDLKYVKLIHDQIEKRYKYFSTVRLVPFLYDLGVRNVIVDKGKVTGIIDLDDVWLGDPLLAIGFGKTILLAMQQDIDFIKNWCNYLGLTEKEIVMVEFYSLLYSVRFMGTIGTTLNGNPSIQTNPANAKIFESIANNCLGFLETEIG